MYIIANSQKIKITSLSEKLTKTEVADRSKLGWIVSRGKQKRVGKREEEEKYHQLKANNH